MKTFKRLWRYYSGRRGYIFLPEWLPRWARAQYQGNGFRWLGLNFCPDSYAGESLFAAWGRLYGWLLPCAVIIGAVLVAIRYG